MTLEKLRARIRDFLIPPEGGVGGELLRSAFFYSPIICPLILFALTGFDHALEKWLNGFVIGIVASFTCILATALFKELDRKIASSKVRPPPQRSRAWWFSFNLCVMPLGIYLGFKANSRVYRELGFAASTSIADANADDYRVGLIIGSIVAVMLFFLRSRHEARERERQSELRIKLLENERLQAQLSALTAQMNPHLMFNALNTVASLVPSHPEKAEETIIKLSELYRGVLNSSRNPSHPLATELELCSAYLDVEKARYGDRLRSKISVAPGIDPTRVEVPALCLQPLVENAVKHGLTPKRDGGEVSITAIHENGELELAVEDDGVGFKTSALSRSRGNGSALNNCRDRLRLHYGAASSLDIVERTGGGSVVRLRMPFSGGIART